MYHRHLNGIVRLYIKGFLLESEIPNSCIKLYVETEIHKNQLSAGFYN